MDLQITVLLIRHVWHISTTSFTKVAWQISRSEMMLKRLALSTPTLNTLKLRTTSSNTFDGIHIYIHTCILFCFKYMITCVKWETMYPKHMMFLPKLDQPVYIFAHFFSLREVYFNLFISKVGKSIHHVDLVTHNISFQQISHQHQTMSCWPKSKLKLHQIQIHPYLWPGFIACSLHATLKL